MESAVLVKSSSRAEPYTVMVSSTKIGLAIFCNCPAGEWNKLCKHKIAIVLGEKDILYNEEQIKYFQTITEWISESRYPHLFSELKDLEKELEAANTKYKSFKDKIAFFMKEGLK